MRMLNMFKTTAVGLLIACTLWCHPVAGATAGTDKEASVQQALEGDPFAGDDGFSSCFDTTAASQKASSGQTSGATKLQTDLHGYLETRNRLRISDGEWLSTRQRIWLELDSSLQTSANCGADAPYRFFASGAIDVDPAAADLSDDTDPARVYLEEAFITIDQPGWHLIAGRKIQRTGTGDGINPMDLVNPVDYRDPVANGRSDSRLPIPLAVASVQLPHYGAIQEAVLEALFIPLARVNRLNASGSPWESRGLAMLRQKADEGGLILGHQQEPDRYFEEVEFGARLGVTFSGWDVGLVGFSGYNDTPVFSASTIKTQGTDTLTLLHLTPVHPKFSAMGLTFAKGFERSTLRGELAWKPDLPLTPADVETTTGYLRRAVTEGVVGIDHTFGVNLYANVQYFFTVTDNAALTVNDTFAHGITYEVHDKFLSDALKSGIRGITSFSDKGWTFETFAEYQPLDDWLLSLSLLLFEGPEDGDYGMFDHNDAITLRLRYSF